ncbi:MAG TPA: hypothetical protein VN493_05015 [Thermoanaerobaculia bacterium]|nr:hypothetical protein [Thermoanaerobaculia bacterium]
MEFLDEERRKPLDPLGLTPEQEVVLYEAVRELNVRFEAKHRDDNRRENRKRALQIAKEQWERLEKVAPARRQAEIRETAALHTWSFCDYLCAESVRQAVRDPWEAIHVACLAVVAAQCCMDLPWNLRLVAYTLAHLANTFRVASKHEKAERLFVRANRLWARVPDSADPGVLKPGRIHYLEAALRKDQRRLPQALACLDRAFEGGIDLGRVLIHKALVLSLMGSYEEAIVNLRRADAVLVDREPRDETVLKYNIGVNLCHLKRFAEAAVLAAAVSDSIEASKNKIDILRSRWLQARVLAGKGERVLACGIYEELVEDFHKRNMTYDLALVSTELSALLLSLGRISECQSLVAGLPSYFEERGIHREALEALRVFSDSVRMQTATEAFARRVVAFLYLARGNRDLRFLPVRS